MNHDNASKTYFSKLSNFSPERRTFLKLNISLFGNQLLPFNKHNNLILNQQDASELFDLLQSIDFSKVVKKEIWFRIKIHKKYGYDSSGCAIPLDRFIKENANFVLYKGTTEDILFYIAAVKSHLDYILIRAAYHNRLDIVKIFLQDVTPIQSRFYERALLASLSNKSLETFKYILNSRLSMDEQCYYEIKSILSSLRYQTHLKQLQCYLAFFNLQNLEKTPIKGSFSSLSDKYYSAMHAKHEDMIIFLEELVRMVKYILEQMKDTGEIEDFDIKIHQQKVHIHIVSEVYPLNFLSDIHLKISSIASTVIHTLLEQLDVLLFECE